MNVSFVLKKVGVSCENGLGPVSRSEMLCILCVWGKICNVQMYNPLENELLYA